MKGRSAEEIEELEAEKEAKTRAILLEMVNIFLYLPFRSYSSVYACYIKPRRMCTIYLEVYYLVYACLQRGYI